MSDEKLTQGDRLDAIHARLDAAKPAPWFWTHHTGVPWRGDGDKADNLISGEYGINGGVLGTDYRKPSIANAELIAHAPEDIRYLLDLVRSQPTEQDVESFHTALGEAYGYGAPLTRFQAEQLLRRAWLLRARLPSQRETESR